MKVRRIGLRVVPVILCFLAVVSLAACGISEDDVDFLGARFLECVMADDYDSAYDMVQSTVSDEDFRAYWKDIRAVAEGADLYVTENTAWKSGTADGAVYATATYLVRFNNGKTAVLRITARTDYPAIAGIHFSDVTEFLEDTASSVRVWRTVLTVIHILSMGFALWAFVDCLRRKMRYKALWAVLIFFGTTLTVAVGQTFNLHFDVGLILQRATAVADAGLLSVVGRVTVPLGAILYCCLRKRFLVDPTAEAEAGTTEPTHEETQA